MPQKTRSTRKTTNLNYKLDAMSITVLLIMVLFGGIVGFYIGESVGANQMLNSLQSTQMMQGR